jgi:hypothetical protein
VVFVSIISNPPGSYILTVRTSKEEQRSHALMRIFQLCGGGGGGGGVHFHLACTFICKDTQGTQI